jgi:hypothetical protein
MPLPTSALSLAQITLFGQISSAGSDSKKTVANFYYARTSNVPVLTKVSFDTIFQSSIVVPLGLALNHRWLQTRNDVRFPDDAQDAPLSFNHAVAGAVAGDSLPTANAVFILFRTGLRGKNFRGGKHFGPLSESDTTTGTDDVLNAGSLALWATVTAALFANLNDSNGNVWVPVVFSRSLSQTRVNPTTIVRNFVASVNINKRVGRLKKRLVASVY